MLDRAEKLLGQSRSEEAHSLAQQVFDQASKERLRHALGTELRWSCTRTISRAAVVLLAIARRAYESRAS
jgi:hypothetical protein